MASRRSSSQTCLASSRVGSSTSSWTLVSLAGRGSKREASQGTQKAPVLPLPVCDWTMTSRPWIERLERQGLDRGRLGPAEPDDRAAQGVGQGQLVEGLGQRRTLGRAREGVGRGLGGVGPGVVLMATTAGHGTDEIGAGLPLLLALDREGRPGHGASPGGLVGSDGGGGLGGLGGGEQRVDRGRQLDQLDQLDQRTGTRVGCRRGLDGGCIGRCIGRCLGRCLGSCLGVRGGGGGSGPEGRKDVGSRSGESPDEE